MRRTTSSAERASSRSRNSMRLTLGAQPSLPAATAQPSHTSRSARLLVLAAAGSLNRIAINLLVKPIVSARALHPRRHPRGASCANGNNRIDMSCGRPAAAIGDARRGSSKLSRGAKKGLRFPSSPGLPASSFETILTGRNQENPCPRFCASLSRASFSPVLPLAPRRRHRQSSPRRPPSRSTPRRSSRTICEGPAPAPEGSFMRAISSRGRLQKTWHTTLRPALAAPFRLRRMRPAERRALRVAAGLRFALSSSAKTRAQFCHRMREEQVAKTLRATPAPGTKTAIGAAFTTRRAHAQRSRGPRWRRRPPSRDRRPRPVSDTRASSRAGPS